MDYIGSNFVENLSNNDRINIMKKVERSSMRPFQSLVTITE